MGPCVYTTQFPTWLEAGSGRAATDLICFRSNKRWVTAAKLLQRFETLPVLFRQQEDSNGILTCRYVAELVEIQFSDDSLMKQSDLLGLTTSSGSNGKP